MKIQAMRIISLRSAVFLVTLLAVAPDWVYGQAKPAAPTITVFKTPT